MFFLSGAGDSNGGVAKPQQWSLQPSIRHRFLHAPAQRPDRSGGWKGVAWQFLAGSCGVLEYEYEGCRCFSGWCCVRPNIILLRTTPGYCTPSFSSAIFGIWCHERSTLWLCMYSVAVNRRGQSPLSAYIRRTSVLTRLFVLSVCASPALPRYVARVLVTFFAHVFPVPVSY